MDQQQTYKTEPVIIYPEEIKGRAEEAALVAACMRRPQIYDEMRELVSAEHFDYVPYREVWQAITTLSERGDGIDQITVGDELDRLGKLNDWICHDEHTFTGRMALSVLRDSGVPINARTYAEIVRDYANKRRIQEIMRLGAIWSNNGRRSADILADLEKKLSEIHTIGETSKHTVTLKESLEKCFEETSAAASGVNPYIESGYPALDHLLDGFSPPDLTLVAGRPGSGKTALLASLVDNIMYRHKKIAVFSLEMSNKQFTKRMISMHSGVSYSKQMTGKMAPDDWMVYTEAVNELAYDRHYLTMNDLPSITPNGIRQELRRIGQVDIIFVDYIQLQKSDVKTDSRVMEVGEVSRGMKAIAKDFNIPVIAAAQLSRAGDNRPDSVPKLSDLRESGSLEQDADNVIFIHRDMGSTNAKIVLAKHRNGTVGECHLTYLGDRTRFVSQSRITP